VRGASQTALVLSLFHQARDFAGCALENAAVGDSGLTLADDPAFRSAAYGSDVRFGLCVSAPIAAPAPFDQVTGAALGASGSGRVELEVRASEDGARWSPWLEVADGEPAQLSEPARWLQYRLTLMQAEGEGRPVVCAVRLDLASSGTRLQALDLPSSKDQHPTVRVWATREGLVGRPTANGHMIVDHDHFAALPSKRVLNANGKSDYQVQVSYKGRSATVPIWDIGPWNTRDNYWDGKRELFPDLPRYTPQALAAWRDGYNNGRDQYGRWVSFPASIDLADGTFWDDLKMTVSDWVDVTFLWVNDSSPPPTPKITVYFKPPPQNDKAAPPPLGTVWYFAEGSTKPPFDTWLLLQNPSQEPARVTLTLMKTDGTTELRELGVGPTSRTSLHMNDLLPDAEFSTRIDASAPVFAERTMYFRRDGHSSMGIAAPSKTWYLAEGSTQEPFDTWILLQNPGSAAASVTVTFMKEDGTTQVFPMTVWPTSRLSLYANAVIPNAGFSTRIVSDQPLVVERTMYLRTGFRGGHGAPGVPTPSTAWYFAEGNTRPGLDTWLLLQNPNDKPATATVTFYTEDGTTLTRAYGIKPNARFSLYARTELDNTRFGMKVESDQPIVAERAMYFGDDGTGKKAGAHDSVGSTVLAKTWYLPDGNTHDPVFQNILIANPNPAPANLTLRFMKPDGSTVQQSFVAPPTSRLTINANRLVPDADISTEVDSDQPVVVESSMYLADMQGGTNTIGIPQP